MQGSMNSGRRPSNQAENFCMYELEKPLRIWNRQQQLGGIVEENQWDEIVQNVYDSPRFWHKHGHGKSVGPRGNRQMNWKKKKQNVGSVI